MPTPNSPIGSTRPAALLLANQDLEGDFRVGVREKEALWPGRIWSGLLGRQPGSARQPASRTNHAGPGYGCQ